MSGLPSLAELKSLALEFGISEPSEILKFVESQQTKYRDDRAAERESVKAKAELEREAALHNQQTAKIQSEVELARIASELELARIRANNERGDPVNIAEPNLAPVNKNIKLPYYKDGDNIVDYITRFERIAQLIGVSDGDKAAYLGSLLSGKALSVYIALSDDIVRDYALLKKELLRGFNKTPESYRLDFRNLRIKTDETFSQFSTTLSKCLSLWIDSLEVEHDYQSLFNMIVMDQLLASVSPELRSFILEQRCEDLNEVIDVAEAWASAHKGSNKCNNKTFGKNNFKNSKLFEKSVDPKESKSTISPFKRDNSKVQCHHCKEFGHIKRLCPILKGIPVTKQVSHNVQSCHKSVARDRNLLTEGGGGGGVCGGTQAGEGTSADGSTTVQFCWNDRTPRRYMVTGSVNGQSVSSIWRDTGCSAVIVSNKILPNVKLDKKKWL